MAEITVKQVRKILEYMFKYKEQRLAKLAQKSDEELLKTNLHEEYNLDFGSLDFTEMNMALEWLYGIKIVGARYSPFFTEPTVANFINTCKEYGRRV